MPLTIDDLIKETDDLLLWETYAAISDSIIGETSPYLERIFEGNPQDSVAIQVRLLDLYESIHDLQYLQAYNEIAIRAQKHNSEAGREIFPISSTYPRFKALLRKKHLTTENLAVDRETKFARL